MKIAKLAWEKKAENIVVLNVSTLTQVTDYFVLMSGQVDQHLKAITDYIKDNLKAEGIRLHHIEGQVHSQWVLMDYVDVVVHLFLPEIRQFYDLKPSGVKRKSSPSLLLKINRNYCPKIVNLPISPHRIFLDRYKNRIQS